MAGALGKFEERVLESNPLLEFFGNTKTLRNNNSAGSSRSSSTTTTGSWARRSSTSFLLEMTRIVGFRGEWR
ncbi:hypothetical protein PR001_g32908 [Phytophthora rubi]|uniref:Myosin motor domain-containing protein n=1 Tax=Phytophthora rubi TaxID=129364 RepID=A0A6A3G4B6_9STRA|nr:hypothetical protein PR001_g32908 [Phytophthora rubi]